MNDKVYPNARDKEHRTPLQLACQNGHVECVKELLKNDKVDLNAKDENQMTLFLVACQITMLSAPVYFLFLIN